MTLDTTSSMYRSSLYEMDKNIQNLVSFFMCKFDFFIKTVGRRDLDLLKLKFDGICDE